MSRVSAEHKIQTFESLLLVSELAFGDRGKRAALLFRQYSEDYFAGEVSPVPVIFVPVSPYGHWIGLTKSTCYVYLLRSLKEEGERAVLLHEMIHVHLFQKGEDPKHQGEPWRREIMRISSILGRSIYAGKYTTRRDKKSEGGTGGVKRTTRPGPNGEESLPHKMIASWPDSIGLIPPPLRA